MAGAPFRIVEAIYPGMTQLDFTAPHTVFSRIRAPRPSSPPSRAARSSPTAA